VSGSQLADVILPLHPAGRWRKRYCSFSFVDARWHKTKSLGQAHSRSDHAHTLVAFPSWAIRNGISTPTPASQHQPACQPAFQLLRPVHRYHSRNAMPAHCTRRAEKRMRRALHPSTLYPTHPSLCTCKPSVPNTANDDVAAPPVPVSHPLVRAVFLPALTTY
jgi:hypothetical protein